MRARLLVDVLVHLLAAGAEGALVDAGRLHEQRVHICPQPLEQRLQLRHLSQKPQACQAPQKLNTVLLHSDHAQGVGTAEIKDVSA